jgi:hypothetical protein
MHHQVISHYCMVDKTGILETGVFQEAIVNLGFRGLVLALCVSIHRIWL